MWAKNDEVNRVDNIKKLFEKKIIITTLLSIFIIHGELLFNKLCWHDDAKYVLRGWNDGLHHGRWMHEVMAKIVEKVSGMESVPVLTGAICAICIAVMACLIFNLFEITDDRIKLALILIFAAIPAVTGHFGYMVSAGYDFIGKMICVVSAYILCKGIRDKRNVVSFVLASVGFACSLGEYQCYVTFYLTILLSFFTMEMLDKRNTWKEFWAKAFYYVGSAIAGLVLYLLILNIFLRVTGMQLTSYAGTDTYGVVSIGEYINRVIFAYKDFVCPAQKSTYNMFPFRWDGWHAGLMAGLAGLMIFSMILRIMKKQYKSVIQCLIAFVLLPLAFNFNFVLYGAGATHSLHMYHFVLLYVYFYILLKGISAHLSEVVRKENVAVSLNKGMYILTTAVVFIFGVLYIRYDNYCYMQTEFRQERAISYFTTMITRIQSTEGYDDDYPIAFINENQKENNADDIQQYYDPIVTNPYVYPMVNSYNWDDFTKHWLGFDSVTKDPADYMDHELVQKMPSYPDDGSIQIIDDVVVVKF